MPLLSPPPWSPDRRSSRTPAQAATNYYSYSAAGWLSSQLSGGLVHNDQFDFDDYGLSLDLFFALDALRTRPAAAVVGAQRHRRRPGQLHRVGHRELRRRDGKLATAAELAGRNPRSFGGVDLVARLQERIHTAADAQHGRGVDQSEFGDFSNTIGQSFVVRGLSGARSGLADDAVAFLLKQQCTAGYFREGLTSADFTCNGGTAAERAPSVDATGFAVQALVAARSNGVRGVEGRDPEGRRLAGAHPAPQRLLRRERRGQHEHDRSGRDRPGAGRAPGGGRARRRLGVASTGHRRGGVRQLVGSPARWARSPTPPRSWRPPARPASRRTCATSGVGPRRRRRSA